MKIFLIIIFVFVHIFLIAQNNQNISQGNVFDGEPYLIVNPKNPQHIIVAWMGYEWLNQIAIKIKVSEDGGNSWSNEIIIPHESPSYSSADPSLAIDKNQILYLCYIDYKMTYDSGAVYIRTSNDGGYTWSNANKVVDLNDDKPRLPIDRPWLSVDTSNSSTSGNLYVTTMNAKGAQPDYHPYYFVSTNGGITWSSLQTLDTSGWLSGNYIAQPMPTNTVSNDGIFYAAYPSYLPSQNILPQFILAKSVNGAASFSYYSMFQTPNSVTDTLAKKGYVLKSDPSDNNHLAFVYLNKSTNDVSDVYFIESFDGGQTWNNPIKVNDDNNNRLQDLVWLSFDKDGDIAITWRDRRKANDTTYTTPYEIYAAVKKANSSTFSQNFSLSDSIIPFDSILNKNGNDFMCNQLLNDTLYSVWGDNRSGKLNIWFQKNDVKGKLLLLKNLINDDLTIFPNPASQFITINNVNADKLYLINNNSHCVKTKTIKSMPYTISVKGVPDGIYFVLLMKNKQIVAKQKVVIKH